MADALAAVEHPVVHVCALPGNTAVIAGNCNIDDETIAEWCAANHCVLVTMDSDFRGRWLRSGVLARHGVEVIVFKKELKGLQEQHLRVAQHLPYWTADLGAGPYEHRIWEQTTKLRPTRHAGPKPR